MYVSIRDDTLRATGFNSIAEGLAYYGLQGVELSVNREYRVHALTPTETQPNLFLNADADVGTLRKQAEEAGVRISALLVANNFNAPDIESELAWIVRVVEVAARLGAPAVRI